MPSLKLTQSAKRWAWRYIDWLIESNIIICVCHRAMQHPAFLPFDCMRRPQVRSARGLPGISSARPSSCVPQACPSCSFFFWFWTWPPETLYLCAPFMCGRPTLGPREIARIRLYAPRSQAVSVSHAGQRGVQNINTRARPHIHALFSKILRVCKILNADLQFWWTNSRPGHLLPLTAFRFARPRPPPLVFSSYKIRPRQQGQYAVRPTVQFSALRSRVRRCTSRGRGQIFYPLHLTADM